MTACMAALLLAWQAPPAPAPATLDETVKGLYSVISGPAGQKRDWEKFKSLFTPEARLIAVVRGRRVVMTPQDYIDRAGPGLERDGFFEKEASREVKELGPVAQVFSRYESRRKAEDEKPFETGVNLIQLSKGEKGWKIEQVLWSSAP